jgi:hypothetical protein
MNTKEMIEYIEKRLKQIDKEFQEDDKYYGIKTSTIYRVLLDQLIEVYNQEKKEK